MKEQRQQERELILVLDSALMSLSTLPDGAHGAATLFRSILLLYFSPEQPAVQLSPVAQP